jgi:hypothetical protein
VVEGISVNNGGAMNTTRIQRLDVNIQSDKVNDHNEINQVRVNIEILCESMSHAHEVASNIKSMINSKVKEPGTYQGDFSEDQ